MFSDTMMLGGSGRKAAFSMENSLLFHGGQLLTRTPIVTGNRKTWTHSVWVRRSQLADSGVLLSSSASGVDAHWLYYTAANDRLYWQDYLGGDRMALRGIANFRDPNAWYHVLIALDTTQIVPSDRAKMYVNGEQVTALDQPTYPDRFLDLHVNTSGRPHFIGNAFSGAGNTLKAAIAEPVFIDGAALTPAHFGEFDPVTLSWRPKLFDPSKVSIWNSETSSAASQYSGNTGLFTFGNGTLDATSGTDGAIKLNRVFSGDFHLSFRWDTDVNYRMLQVGVMKKAWADAHFNPSNNHFGALSDAYVAGNAVDCLFAQSSAYIFDTRNAGNGTALGNDPAAGNVMTVSRSGGTVTMSVNGVSANAETNLTGDVQIGLAHSGSGSYYVDVSGLSWQFNNGDTGYGTNGFHLGKPWNAASLGTDYSGRGNHWTPSGFVASDVVLDTPTNVFAALNPLSHSTGGYPAPTLSNGALTATYSSNNGWVTGTTGVSSGKWYWEAVSGAGTDTIGTALDLDAGVLTFYKNGVSQGVAQTGLSGLYFPINQTGSTGTWVGVTRQLPTNVFADSSTVTYNSYSGNKYINDIPTPYSVSWVAGTSTTFNFGQRAFAHTPPTGFKTLCTANLPAPAIAKPYQHMTAVAYTGTGTAQAINCGFQPDLVWIKDRNHNLYNHALIDSVRGTSKMLFSSNVGGESTYADTVTAFTPTGFTLGADVSTALVNYAGGHNYIAWCWKAGGSAVSNTSGSIMSQVSANPAAGFSVVGANMGPVELTNYTFGHGLGTAPAFVIVKDRNSGTANWHVWHKSLSGTNSMQLNLIAASGAVGAFGAVPDASVLTLTTSSVAGGDPFVAYCWSEIPGYSKFGSYVGNASVDGPFVYCGFRPRYVLIKRADSIGDWIILDTVRDAYNETITALCANSTGVDQDGAVNKYAIDVDASGFKLRANSVRTEMNESGGTYVFAAFAEFPLGGGKVTPATAR